MNANDSVGVRLGQIMDESVRLAQAAWPKGLLYVVVVTALGAFIDQQSGVNAGNAGNLMFSVVSFALGYVLTISMLRDGGLVPNGLTGGFGSYFGASLLSGLGIGLGFLVLIIPGLVLLVRWAPAYGFVLGEGTGVSEGLSKAWEQTGAHFWPLALALLPPVAINLGAAAIYFLASNEDGFISMPMSLLANGITSTAGVAITAVGLAAYALLRDRRDELVDVFA
jgi:hypothetical protein